MRAAIVGIAGLTLSAEEAALFRAHPPAGVILFKRNIADPEQLAALIASLRGVLRPDAVMMVDQEGGRVARLRPPYWREHPPAAMAGDLFAGDEPAGLRLAWLNGALIGLDCLAAGFDVACAPVLDLRQPGAHDVIGDRAFSADPDAVGRLAGAMAAGLLAAGVQPVGKHAPGHGRARVDSHLSLPLITDADLTSDLQPFITNADLPWMMTAHILYTGLDADHPATLSPTIIGGIIRGEMGFEGVLVTDDLAMHALSGAPADLAIEALAAGCDVALYCAGDFALTESLLHAVGSLSETGLARLTMARTRAEAARRGLDGAALADERARLLA